MITNHMKKIWEEEEKKHKEAHDEEMKWREKEYNSLKQSISKEFKNPEIEKRQPGKDPEVLNNLAKHKDPHKKKWELLKL